MIRNQTQVAQTQLKRNHDFIPSAVALKEVTEAYLEASVGSYSNKAAFTVQMRDKAIDAILRRLVAGTLVARCEDFELYDRDGDKALDEEQGTLPRIFWHYVRIFRRAEHQDWLSGDFTVECYQDRHFAMGHAYAVRFDRAGLPLVNEPLAPAQSGTSMGTNAGAPRKWDWDGALAYLAALSHCTADGLHRPDGNDPTQSDIAEHMEAWFIGSTGQSPATSLLREHAKRVVQEINALKLQTANNRKVA